MRTLLHTILSILGLAAAFVVLATLLGLGVVRQGPPILVALSATALVMLPPLGIAAFHAPGERRAWGAALLVWSLGVFVSIPLYFPGERMDAMTTGFALAGSFLGVVPAPELVAKLDALVPEPSSRPVPARAEEPTLPVLPPSQAFLPDQVALPFEGRRNTLLLPISIDTAKGEHEYWMLFDTGATLTTFTTSDLREMGVKVSKDAPQVTMHTAAGDRTARLVLLDQLWIGGFPVAGVTVSVCDACADDRAAGLLGLNVSGQFLVTLDTVRHEVVLQPRTGKPDRTLDIQPWIDVSGNAVRWPDGRSEVEVTARNASDRDVDEIVVHVACERPFEAVLHDVPARGEKATTVVLPRDVACDRYSLELETASW